MEYLQHKRLLAGHEPHRAAAPSYYLRGKAFDISLFVIGLTVPVIFLLLYLSAAVPMGPIMLAFILLLDVPHAMQTFTRTAMDREGREQFGRRSLYCFVAMVVINGLLIVSGNSFYILVILLFYGSYHIILQHFGIAVLYRARSKEALKCNGVHDKRLLMATYSVCLAWATHDLFNMGPLWLWPQLTKPFDDLGMSFVLPFLNQVWQLVVLPATAGYFLVAVIAWLRALKARNANNAAINKPWFAVILLAVINYFFVFFGLNAFANSLNEGLFFTVIGITAWHAVQYHGLVWFYNNKKFSLAENRDKQSRFLSWLSQTNRYPFYMIFMVLITLATQTLVLGLQWLDWHVVNASLGETLNLAYLGYSVTFTHYYLDSLIWKSKHNKELAKIFS